MRYKKFACFILTHGRPKSQKTYKTLRRCGYKGDIYFIIDDEDESGEEYRNIYKNKVITFSKEDSARNTDACDIIKKKNTVLFARNMCFKIDKNIGLEYFLELDDDYNSIRYRYINGCKLDTIYSKNIDKIFDLYIDFLESSGALCVCFAQSGDFIGGASSFADKRIMRKAMNAFFCKTSNPFSFIGRMNDDVNTYVSLSHKGKLFFTLSDISINQEETQQQSGGLTEMYKDNGTYMKSFYTVMICPSSVKISTLNSNYKRIHHKINWNHCAPKILNPKWKKD